ncbi:hypothetical protein BC938DRAFT_472498 [Jimgerdemannia flammicorona]|uniref:Uncharacterized protein n=1 Tax=Jimgerdemannia flammicorona TaxID=994334 RepID=A0A433Q609_9FUNG|nr:hypothetical protein BC938DRAFT_472498 [Jimgerdemannia flammicorona]
MYGDAFSMLWECHAVVISGWRIADITRSNSKVPTELWKMQIKSFLYHMNSCHARIMLDQQLREQIADAFNGPDKEIARLAALPALQTKGQHHELHTMLGLCWIVHIIHKSSLVTFSGFGICNQFSDICTHFHERPLCYALLV